LPSFAAVALGLHYGHNWIRQSLGNALADWKEKRAFIQGNDKDVESLNGLKAVLLTLGELSLKIAGMKDKQSKLALDIHTENLAQATVFRTL
jgi:hypothetical protein